MSKFVTNEFTAIANHLLIRLKGKINPNLFLLWLFPSTHISNFPCLYVYFIATLTLCL
ncbi:hypothetical protein H6H03_19865 [Nostoc paludosum FACHB-159]|uniref:Uncharacterized protein n=1 Tax=Nostoc paludosum FACHB-159 TaxID=2692908 RepID=A0ABR8KAQ1_9NOSO|nr:hypothetical protein [Nostoc paludosum FACHB-159]